MTDTPPSKPILLRDECRALADECRNMAAKLRRLSPGMLVYRVQDPTGAYCLQLSHSDTFNPYNECLEYLEREQAKGRLLDYVVACKQIHSEAERAMHEAAGLLDRFSGREPMAEQKPTRCIAIWSDVISDYVWYERPKHQREFKPAETSELLKGATETEYFATGRFADRPDGERAEIFE